MRVLTLAFLVLTAAPLFAQSSQTDAPSSQPRPRATPDFLFGRPDWSIGVRGSWLLTRKQSDWYDFVQSQLTLDDSDFNSGAFGMDVGVALTSRADLVFGFDYGQTNSPSEYRNFVDNLRLPIEQQTRMRETSLTGGLRFSLTERGREVGNFAWVPRTVVPYVGAGAGLVWFQVRQWGDFVDFVRSLRLQRRVPRLRLDPERPCARWRGHPRVPPALPDVRRPLPLGGRRPWKHVDRLRSDRSRRPPHVDRNQCSVLRRGWGFR